MIQKKICMVGMFGTGKTSLVQQFVHSRFSEKYHSTIGVKIDRKDVQVGETAVKLLLWDLAGKDGYEDVRTSYLRGAAGLFLVADGTRRETFFEIGNLRDLTQKALGDLPLVVALNKFDLTEQWQLGEPDYAALRRTGCHTLLTSAKTGDGVEEAFHWLAEATTTP